jgi:hypothetical protein
MAALPHFEARLAIHGQLKVLLHKGCERWQAADESASLAAFRRLGRKPKLRTFLDEEYENAAYQFWRACQQGTKTPEDTWIETERAFEQFMIRLRRPGVASGKRWFDSDDLKDFEDNWEAYWEIEKKWLVPFQERRASLKLFVELGGNDMVALLKGNKTDRFEQFGRWWMPIINEPYDQNDYRKSRARIAAIMIGGVTALEQEQDVSVKKSVVYGISEAILSSSMIAMSIRDNFTIQLVGRYQEAAKDCFPFQLYSACVFPISERFRLGFLSPQPEDFWNLSCGLHALLGGRQNAIENGANSIDNGSVLAAIGELLRIRNDIVDLNNPILSARIQFFTEKLAPNYELACGFWEHPIKTLDQEWKFYCSGISSSRAVNASQLAGFFVQIHSRSYVVDRAVEAEWLVNAIDALALADCSHLLAWSDVYSLCEQYMRRRGNPILAREAMLGQQKLQLAALGDNGKTKEFEQRLLDIESEPITASQKPRPSNEEQIRQLLLGEPPPLQKKKPQRKR